LSKYSEHSSATVRASRSAAPLGGIDATRDVGEGKSSMLAGFVRGQHAEAPDRDAAASATPVPILQNEALGAGRLYPKAETGEFAIPREHIAARLGVRSFNGADGQLGHGGKHRVSGKQ